MPGFSTGQSESLRELEIQSLNQGKKYYRRCVRITPLIHALQIQKNNPLLCKYYET